MENMKTSPIRLNSSKKAKLRVSRSPSAHHDQSTVNGNQNSRLSQSFHTVKPNQHMQSKIIEIKTLPRETQQTQSHAFTNYVNKTVRPIGVRSPFKTVDTSTYSRGTKSFYDLPRPNGIVVHRQIIKSSHSKENNNLSPFRQNLDHPLNNNSPIKAILENQKSFIKVQLGKARSPVRVIGPAIKMRSPPKVISQVVYQPTAREIELQRKVKILEMRVGELHNEKNLVESKMNEMNIRLQYENNFLRQKLNKFPSNKNIRPFQNIDNLVKTVSSQEEHMNQPPELKEMQVSCPQKIESNLVQVKENEKYSKTSDGFYQKSKEVQSFKQQLLETEEMLSKQIEKSLRLLEQLSHKEKENEEMKSQVKKLQEQVERVRSQSLVEASSQNDQKFEQLKLENTRLEEKLESLEERFSKISQEYLGKDEYIKQLETKVQELKLQPDDNMVPKQLLDEMQQNNQILISAMTPLQNSVTQSQNQISALNIEKQQLLSKISQLQSQLQEKKSKLEQKQNGNQSLQEKMDESQMEIRQSHNKLQAFQLLVEEKNQVIEEKALLLDQKDRLIKNLQEKVQQLEARVSESEAYISWKMPQKSFCNKCGELRRTVIRLNSYLNNCSSEFSREAKQN